MINLPISKELKTEIQSNQNQLKNAICNHQDLILKLKEDPENVEIQKGIESVQQEIVSVGLQQKGILEQLRKELKLYEKNLQENNLTAALEEKRNNLTNAINRARKQTISIRPVSAVSFSGSDDSSEIQSSRASPELSFNPLQPNDLSQNKFLHYYGLCSHETYKELINKRAERKRRSTANPQFLYSGKGWDNASKRKRAAYLLSSLSPPNTRQSVKNRNRIERSLSSPGKGDSPPESPIETSKKLNSFPNIPNLPSGLTIERVNPARSSPEDKSCVVCRSSGNLQICESCTCNFHVACHNRPLVQTPRKCPRCISNKEVRTVGSLSVPSGMTVSCVTVDASVQEKLKEKEKLEDTNRQLAAELTQLQDRHSQLTISLREQKIKQQQLMTTHQTTKTKIQNILDFINSVKSRSCRESEKDEKKSPSEIKSPEVTAASAFPNYYFTSGGKNVATNDDDSDHSE